MRTTVTLDPDVAQRLGRVMKRRKASFKRVLNDALRQGLNGIEQEPEPLEPFVVKPFDMDLLVDVTCTGRLMADWDVEDFLETDRKLRAQISEPDDSR